MIRLRAFLLWSRDTTKLDHPALSLRRLIPKMRPSTASGSLAMLFKIVSGLLLLHLLAGCTSAFSFRTPSAKTPLAVRYIHAFQVSPSMYKRGGEGDVPGADEIFDQVRLWGVVGRLPSVFYTESPMDLSEART